MTRAAIGIAQTLSKQNGNQRTLIQVTLWPLLGPRKDPGFPAVAEEEKFKPYKGFSTLQTNSATSRHLNRP